jgi:hypothetical protein
MAVRAANMVKDELWVTSLAPKFVEGLLWQSRALHSIQLKVRSSPFGRAFSQFFQAI